MAGTPLVLKVRTKKGLYKIQCLTCNNTLNDLKKAISDLTGIQYSHIKILKGYPPKPLDSFESSTLSSLYIRDGDLLTIEESATPTTNSSSSYLPSTTTSASTTASTATPVLSNPTTTATTTTTDNMGNNKSSSNICESTDQYATSTTQQQQQQKLQLQMQEGILLRREVPSDNSCLFTSVYYVMENGKLNLDAQKFLRDLIAQTVISDKQTFNEAILGKKNKEYCDWIKNTSNWGGAIEIMILSKYYKTEICVVDIQSGRIDRFGEDCSYPVRVFIIYDGIHFDPLYLQPLDNDESQIQTRFLSNDEFVMHQAYEMANEAKKARQFTDVNTFKLKCLQCNKLIAGQKEAQEHAERSGHVKFDEV